MKIKTQTVQGKNNRRRKNIIISIIAAVLILFLVAGICISAEINSLYAQLDEQRQLLNDSLDKTVTSYLETKYLGMTAGNDNMIGEINGDELTEEQIQQLVQAVLGAVNKNLTDDIYEGTSQLAADKLRSSIAEAIQKALISMGISSETISDEVLALVMKEIEVSLNEHQKQLLEQMNDISNISNMVTNSETRIANLNSSISRIQTSYEKAIDALKKVDANLAARIDALLKDSGLSQDEYNRKVAELNSELEKLKNDLNAANADQSDRYNDLINELNNAANQNTTTAQDLQKQIEYLQNTLSHYLQNNAVRATITPRTDGGNGNQLTITVP